ncbi:MAG TPA: DinB family protein [Gemmatimonadales bacterium]|nr:DinB family protein [Gemmatimonadales bacterium]
MRICLAMITGLAWTVVVPLTAQSPVSDVLRMFTTRAARNLVGSAETMPPDKYAYKPTAPQMSFADVIVHVAGDNASMCGWIAGATPPEQPKLTNTDSKDKLVAALRGSFDYCSSALSKVDDSKLADSVPFFGRKMTRAAVMMILASDWSDHYSQMAIYLRLNGLLPPTAKHKEG